MAEAVVSALMEVLFQKIASQIFEKNGLLGGSTKKEMLNLQGTLSTIQAVLQDAEDRQMKEKAVKNWLVKLKDIVYEADDLLDDYLTELLCHKLKLKEIGEKLELVANERAKFHFKDVVHQKGFSFVSIVGIGGIEKTTVAKLVYNDAVVENSFDTRIWVCVSEIFACPR
ncbi:putative disease resistance protein RGA4 [Capsicum chacoense]